MQVLQDVVVGLQQSALGVVDPAVGAELPDQELRAAQAGARHAERLPSSNWVPARPEATFGGTGLVCLVPGIERVARPAGPSQIARQPAHQPRPSQAARMRSPPPK